MNFLISSLKIFFNWNSKLEESKVTLVRYLIPLFTEISNSLFKSLFMQVVREDIKLIPSQDLISNIDELLGSVTAYDASYVNLARKLNIPLCTSDKKLAKAASQYCDVICYN